MGVRGEMFSTRVARENRTYFFNVKENRKGEMFLTIVESKHSADGSFERHQVMVFQEDFPDFAESLEKVIGFMKKERYKRATGRGSDRASRARGPEGDAPSDADTPAEAPPADTDAKKPKKVHVPKSRPRSADWSKPPSE